MVKVSIEVRSGATRFAVAVRAESILEGRYPGRDIQVKFPIDPGGYFVEDPTTRAELFEVEQPKEIAA